MKTLARRDLLKAGGLLALRHAGAAAPPKEFEQNLIAAPREPGRWPEFRTALGAWRKEKRSALGYSDVLYARSDFAWVPSCFSCCFLMLCDETFYDHRRGRFTVASFLDEGVREFGGYDAVVLWHAYPRIGLDPRNQFDFYRDLPGGLAGVRELSRALHARKVKVFLDYNPWDKGTRREDVGDIDALIALLSATDADGLFLDTMSRGAAEFRARLDKVRPGLVLEGEAALPLENLHDHHMSWAQWFVDSEAPGVLRNKWVERRHMMHQICRWHRDHTAELHTAWMNGSGMLVWENVFGSWNGWSGRDRSILRAMLPVQRRYAALFSGESWTPLVPAAQADVYASLWEGGGLRLWTLVNRSGRPVEGDLLTVAHSAGSRYWDLLRGREVTAGVRGGEATLTGALRPRGIGAFLAGAAGADFRRFLASQAALDARANWSTVFPARKVEPRAPTPSPAYRKEEVPRGMVTIPGGSFHMRVEFRVRECGFYESETEMLLNTRTPALHKFVTFERDVTLKPYAIGLTPVTNAQYAAFLKATRYRPRHAENFLKHWNGDAPPAGLEDHPVVYVDLDDARAYAKWVGGRLPSEEEWQYAAQGPDGLRYPWGEEMKPGVCNEGDKGGTTPVMAFPAGQSPFGCYDMCGNTWEWTESERSDGRTRFSIIRGGAYYRARGSVWYMDGGPQPANFAAKFLHTWPGLDRCATVGFRCAADISA